MGDIITALISRTIRRAGPGRRRGDITESARPAAGRRPWRPAPARRPGRRRRAVAAAAGGTGARAGGLRAAAAASAAWPAAGVMLVLMAAAAPAAYAAAGGTPSRARSARKGKPAGNGTPSSLPQDLSATLPDLDYGAAVGDFTGVGHDQLAYAANGQLVIAEADKYGGAIKSQVPTNLQATPNGGLTDPYTDQNYYVWDPYQDWLSQNGAAYGMTGVKVAADASNIYMAGATWAATNVWNTYYLLVGAFPHDGSCANTDSISGGSVATLPGTYAYSSGVWDIKRVVVPTSLAVGVVGGQTLIAVGLSDWGIYILSVTYPYGYSLPILNQVANLTDMGAGGDPPVQTPVTALAFGPPSGPGQGGLLVGGVETAFPYLQCFTWRLNPDGTENSVAKAATICPRAWSWRPRSPS